MPPSKKRTRKVPVEFGADQDYLIAGITADVTTLECVFDLIDNSIDAARNDLLAKTRPKLDDFGLPASYAGYEIKVSVNPGAFSISDNCSGMSESTLSKKSFKTGAKSNHPFGIGHFGIGLNRSVFKLGKAASLATDDGLDHIDFSFTEQEIRKSEGKDIFAFASPSTGKKMNRLEITELHSEIVQDFKSQRWLEAMEKDVRRRYGRFIKKGLKLLIDDVELTAFDREIEQKGFFPPVIESAKLPDGVKFFLEAGVHKKYDASPGAGASGKNKNLSREYGWYVVCNDRTILVEDRSPVTGWGAWHPEYNGFVGWAHYVSKQPQFLPWDSKKTSINQHSPAYTASIDLLSETTQKFRTANRKRLKKNSESKKEGSKGGNSQGNSNGSAGNGGSGSNRNGKSPGDTSGNGEGRNHTSDIDTVFVPCDVKSNKPKIASLVIEASTTPVQGYPYRAAVILRILIEHAIRDYLARHKHYPAVKAHSIAIAEKRLGRELTEDEIKKRRIEMDDVMSWVINHPEIWPEGSDKGVCRNACAKYQVHLKKLNGVIHDAGEIMKEGKVIEIRDDMMTFLIVILEH